MHRHPVSMAFHMDYLDPEDQRAVRRWSVRIAVVFSSLALLLFAAIAGRISTPDQADAIDRESATGILQIARVVGMSRAIAAEPVGVTQCALRDLRIVTSIEAHGEAQDVPADKLANAFFTMMNARAACAAGRIDEALATYDSIVIASNTPRTGWFTPRCAERDLRAFGVIEEFGQADGMPSAWLADAGQNYLQARIYCLSGAENEGVNLYDRIIAGDTRMSNEWTMNARVRP